MAQDSAIQIERPKEDRVRAAQLVGIALVCVGVGIGLVYGLSKPSSAAETWAVGIAQSSDGLEEAEIETDVSPARAGGPEAMPSDSEAVPIMGSSWPQRPQRTNEPLFPPVAGPAPQTAVPRAWAVLAAQGDTSHEHEHDEARASDVDRTLDADDSGADDLDPLQPGRAARSVRASGKRAGDADDVQLTAAAFKTRATGSSKGRPLGERRLQRGAVTYLRCDGALRHNKRPGQCPRDRRLEAGVWKALKDLPQCRVADPGTGRAQLKLTMKRRAAPQIEMAGPDAGFGLNLRAVNKCAAPDLARLKTHLRASHAVITFAFGLN